jgi:hypothetical protein
MYSKIILFTYYCVAVSIFFNFLVIDKMSFEVLVAGSTNILSVNFCQFYKSIKKNCFFAFVKKFGFFHEA